MVRDAMNASALRITQAGMGNTVQDRGRRGWRALGLPWAGALDLDALAAANALVDNPPDAAALEVPMLGPSLRGEGRPVLLGLLGFAQASVIGRDGQRRAIAQPAATSLWLQVGEELVLGATQGTAYLSVAGGVQVDEVLASRSTYARAAMGGMQGRAIALGDALPVASVASGVAKTHGQLPPWWASGEPLRVMPAPQTAAFSPAMQAAFAATDWRLSAEADRMGMRLLAPEGAPALRAEGAWAQHMVSDGIVPGAIQVAPNGQPMVMLADGQTVGGYPKLACVIQADLPRLAHLRPGQVLRFAWVTAAQALAAARAQAQALQDWRAGLRPLVVEPSTEQLLSTNLISGGVDAHDHNLLKSER